VAVDSLPEEEMGEGGHLLAEINVTPLIDIFLVLLIIFMVTSSILSESGGTGLKVNLPAGEARLEARGRQLLVGISASGEVVIEGRPVPRDLLAATFQQALAQDPEVVVVLHADRQSFTGEAVEVMELAKRAGVRHLGIATRQQGGR